MNMKVFLRQVLFLLDREVTKQLPWLLVLFVVSSLLDVIGIGMVGVFLAFIVDEGMLHKIPIYLQLYLRDFNHNELISWAGIIVIFAFIFKAFVGIYTQKKFVFMTTQFTTRLKTRLMVGYQNATYAFHLKQNTAYLQNYIGQASVFAGMVTSFLGIVSNVLITGGIVISLLVLHPVAMLVLALLLGFFISCYDMFLKRKFIHYGKTIALASGEINKSIIQMIGGLKEIRILGKETYFLNRMKNATYDHALAISSNNAFALIPRYVIESVAAIFLIVLTVGMLWIGMSPLSIVPTIGIFSVACIRLLPAANQLMSSLNQIRSSSYATNMVYEEVYALERRYNTTLETIHSHRQDKITFSQFFLKQVSFRYSKAKRDALVGINLTIHRNQSIGLIGSSGSGKSTLVSVILGLLTPTQGQILVDGQSIQNLRAWLNNFAYIPQHIFLLDDTLKRNIAMGVEDKDINLGRLNQAIQMAQLMDVVEELPEGVDTFIGENGVRLSGGQRQRVALARAFYHERDIIIMDEATSALDNETEREIIRSIKRLKGIKTLIVIAHRLTTIQYCDLVYKLERGKVIACGPYDEIVGSTRSSVAVG